MKYIAFIILVFGMSCTNEPNNVNQSGHPLPAALQDDKSGLTSYKRSGGNLLEDLYQEAIDKSATLQTLEAAIKSYETKYIALNDSFLNYDNKSSGYYQSATFLANGISDSLLKKTVLNFIDASMQKYNRKKGELSETIVAVSKRDSLISDRYRLLKILLTYSMMENYQDQKLPSPLPFKDFLRDQDSLLEAVKKATPQL